MTDLSNNEQIIDPELNGQSIEEFIEQLNGGFEYAPSIKLSQPIPNPTDPEDGPDEDGDDEEAPDEETPQEPDDDNTVDVNGNRVPLSDIQRLYEFDQYLRLHPDVAERVAQAVTPSQPQPTVPGSQASAPPQGGVPPEPPVTFTPPTPPPNLDLEDPAIALLWDQSVANAHDAWKLRNELSDVRSNIQSRFGQLDARNAEADMSVALNQFRTSHPNINDDDLATIRKEAVPFFTSFHAQLGNPVAALTRSMEVAGLANASTRTKMLDTSQSSPTAKQQSSTRKRKLSSLSGSPTSAPKTVERPKFNNDRDMVNAIASEIESSWATN